MSRAAVSLPGTCGELVQGTLDGTPFLVSCPIGLFSTVEVRLDGEGVLRGPKDAPKAMAAVHSALRYLGRPERGGSLRIRSRLPRGKGYASSTADVAGAIAAVAAALDGEIPPEAAARLALEIEPSDSTMFPGLALMDHRGGRLFEPLGSAPPLALIVVDEGGTVDTLEFNRRLDTMALRLLAGRHREALETLKRGLASRDWYAVGQAATLSALANQEILPKALWEPVRAIARDLGALGVCAAHSGTLLGLLLDPSAQDLKDAVRYARRRLPARGVAVCAHLLTGGGAREAP
jgi:L-threonine kinase